MGWGDCGEDSNGRPIGYIFEATCDHPNCNKQIDRGLSYVCGEMHGEDEYSCEKYFCEEHRMNTLERCDGSLINICDKCYEFLLGTGEWIEDAEEGLIKQISED